MKKQSVAVVLGSLMVLGANAPALAQNGFYGGLSMRDTGAVNGLTLGDVPLGDVSLAWNRFSAPTADETAQRSLLFGGYRWKNDLSVEGAFSTTDKYSLQPAPSQAIASVPGLALTDANVRSWNANVFTSWELSRTLSLYGRLGYAQSDARQLTLAGASLVPGDPRRLGVNYGVGVRYDVTHSLGLRAEYSRFGRFAGEAPSINSGLPDSDQVTVGVQYRF
ncbi:MAG TPA: outer membrane beta-barrel protein [Casimicrobiaceae bacterium]